MTMRKVWLILLLSGCATQERIPLSVPAHQAATIVVAGNPSFWGSLFWSVITLGFINDNDLSEVRIRKINDVDVYSEKIRINPGPCKVGLILSGSDERKSKGILYLEFEAAPNASYTVTWSQASLHEKWSAEIQHNGIVARADGETFVPEITGRKIHNSAGAPN